MWKRLTAIAVILAICFSCLYMRVGTLASLVELSEAGLRQSSYTVSAGTVTASIYDRNFVRLNNRKSRYVAVLPAEPEGFNQLRKYLVDPKVAERKLLEGKPFACEVREDVSKLGVPCFLIPDRSGDCMAIHLVGYEQNGMGMSGLEKSFQEYFDNHKKNYKVSFTSDAKGGILGGVVPQIETEDPVSAGIVTTIDSKVQSICQKAAFQMKRGAVVVMNPKNGEIIASVSVPSYSVDTLEIALKSEDAPMINRALSSYSVGSAFKVVIAAAALREGKEDFLWDCTGEIEVAGQKFRCHNREGHGVLTMKEAMAESCNTYFIALGQELSSQNLLDTASSFGFGRSSILAPGLVSSSGNLQTISDLSDPAEKGNFSFGQGMLTATPLQVSMMMSVIANKGKLMKAKLVLGTSENGADLDGFSDSEATFTNVLDAHIANQIKEMLIYASESEGQAKCRPKTISSGGKTSTAQTGQYEGSHEIVQTWFSGFFPADDPEFVVTVLCENGKSGNSSAGPIFAEIADGIAELYQLHDSADAEIPVIFPKND